MKRMLIMALFAVPLCPQSVMHRALRLDGGVLVLYQTYRGEKLAASAEPPTEAYHDAVYGKAEAAGHSIRRTFFVPQDRAWFGYEIRIERLGEREAFRVSVEPLNGIPFFAHRPEPREINAGDRIFFDVLEDRGTGATLYDMLQVGFSHTPMQTLTLPRGVPRNLQPGAILRLSSPRLDSAKAAEPALSATGGTVGFALPRTGRVLFSSIEQPGFSLGALAEDRVIDFSIGREKYRLQCDSPVVAAPGAWHLWYKHEPAEATAAVEVFAR